MSPRDGTKGISKCEVGNCIDGIRVFLMRYLSFRADIEWIESRESESLILVGNCEENSLRSWCARVHSVEIVIVVDDDSYDSLRRTGNWE